MHHIIFRNNGGSDDESNLITLCKSCHDRVHAGEIYVWSEENVRKDLKYATQMNIIISQLHKKIEFEETFGYITKEHRQLQNAPKKHYVDAIMIASCGEKVKLKIRRLLRKKCVSDGDYQKTKGIRNERKIPTGKIFGFRKFDKVQYLGGKYFIKSKMSNGYAVLMNISGEKQNFEHIPKFKDFRRVGARKSWIMSA